MKAFRFLIVKASLLLTIVAAGLAFPWDSIAAKGVLLGGVASTLGFWIAARNLQLANAPENALKFRSRGWFAIRMLLYLAVLFKGYSLDVAHLHGFFGAAGGLFAVRLVVTVIGLTGWDLK
jgi:hypothetical protein